jgi:L-asparaginase II
MSGPFVPLVVTRRSGLDESFHEGAVVALERDGSIAFALGDPNVITYPRSSNKPMQATAMVRAGLDLPPRLLALVCASHSGEPMHIAAVRELLAGAGLDESALGNTADLPIDDDAAAAVLRAGGGKSSILMNCSGKHSGMLATCKNNGWATDASYLDPRHPLQQRVTATIDELTGVEHVAIGVDGCGAPAHAMALIGLARAFRAIAMERGAVYTAMTSHPEMVGGTGRDVTEFMRGIPGLCAKDGAEGVFAAALPDGRAVALKIADGASRARPAAMAAALDRLGVDVSGAASAWRTPVLGHGKPVGEIRAVGELGNRLRFTLD